MKSDVRTNFVQTFDFTVKALMISNSLHHRYFQMKTDMNVKIGSYTKLCMQNKILASKMRNLKQQKTSVFAPLILKRWIALTSVTEVGFFLTDSLTSKPLLRLQSGLCNQKGHFVQNIHSDHVRGKQLQNGVNIFTRGRATCRNSQTFPVL